MVYLKRTLHSVGQGAFFTEQFVDDNMDKPMFNVVYDCGSSSAGIKTQMERDIRNTFYYKKQIDVLFLSHFDNDHVNYVSFLQKRGYLQGTRIFIPMLAAEEWLGIEPYITNYKMVLSLNNQNLGGTKVIQVEFDKDNTDDYVNGNDPLPINEVEGGFIPSGTTMVHKIGSQGIVWCYTPFNIQFNALITEFKNGLNKKGLDYNQLKNSDYVTRHEDDLKEAYRGLGKKPLGGTAINLNSLLVMSYPKDKECCDFIRDRWIRYWCYDCLFGHRNSYPGSCLYTGDTSANELAVWIKIEHMINRCLGYDSILSLLQVPHHGSRKSYDQKLVNSDRFAYAFTNYDPYYRQHIFDENLPLKLAVNHKPLIRVTREYASQFEEYFQLAILDK